MPADVKANAKQQEIVKNRYKKGVYFSVDFAWYSIYLDIVR